MNHEDSYAEEIREEVIEEESQDGGRSKKGNLRIRMSEEVVENNDESSPLISEQRSSRRALHKRGYSYQRAINEPWTGAHGSGHLPWYKKPSVSAARTYLPLSY